MGDGSLVPTPRPAFRRLQYGKAGRGLGTRLGDGGKEDRSKTKYTVLASFPGLVENWNGPRNESSTVHVCRIQLVPSQLSLLHYVMKNWVGS